MPVATQCGRCGVDFFAAASPDGLCPQCLFSIPDLVTTPSSLSSLDDAEAGAAAHGPRSPRLINGTRLGRYEVLASLGQGGMGEVYRARDARLGRSVAIKVLPAAVSADRKRRARLEREAQLVSHLNHPHICALFDVGEQDGIAFLVMEYLEGETLLDRLRRGPLSIDEVLRYASEIADALDGAHRQGVIHRDLKPGNIMLTASGAKLLDFGLATLDMADPAGLLLSVPADAPLSGERTLAGTMRYMSPEQLEGRPADPRSDLFAFGLILYEMTAGRPAFAADSDASLMLALLCDEPPRLSSLRDVPPALEQLIDTCVAKKPHDRWQTAKDVLLQLKWMTRHPAAVSGAVRPSRPSAAHRPWIAASAATAVVAALASVALRPSSASDVVRYTAAPPARSAFATLSPDGRRFLWLGESHGDTRLWVQTRDSLTATALDGTEGAQAPFWSPDSQSIGFFANGTLKRMGVADGPAVTVAAAPFGLGGAWNHDGTLVFAPDRSGGLVRADAGGGAARALTSVNRASGETSHRWPSFLPDGRHFLYLALGTGRDSGTLHVGSLDSSADVALGPAEYEEAIRLKPTYAAAHLNLADALEKSGRLDMAIQEYRRAAELEQRSACYRELGLALAKKGELAEARIQLEHAIRLDPGDGEAHRGLAEVLRRQGRVREAAGEFQEALNLNPNDESARTNLDLLLLVPTKRLPR